MKQKLKVDLDGQDIELEIVELKNWKSSDKKCFHTLQVKEQKQ